MTLKEPVIEMEGPTDTCPLCEVELRHCDEPGGEYVGMNCPDCGTLYIWSKEAWGV